MERLDSLKIIRLKLIYVFIKIIKIILNLKKLICFILSQIKIKKSITNKLIQRKVNVNAKG